MNFINISEEDEKKEQPEQTPNDKREPIQISLLTIVLVLIGVVLVSVFSTYIFLTKALNSKLGATKSSSVDFGDSTLSNEEIAKFQNIIDFIKDSYYKEYDMDDLIEGAISGLVGALDDPYGNYYAPGKMEEYTEFVEGSYVGIGLKTFSAEEGMEIKSVLEDSPAAKAGLREGDVITTINNRPVKEMYSEEIAAAFSAEGSEIKLEVIIKETSEKKEFTLFVEKIVSPSVIYKLLGNDISYIQITQFIPGTAEEFKKAISLAESAPCRGIIIDLRGNPGGYEREASQIADIILPKGTIATSKDRFGNVVKTVTSDANEINAKVCLIVNQGTASAAELLTGAFRDFKKGEIIGVHTYGKALAQQNRVYQFDGSGIVLTTSRYFTPSGECIDGVGIEPTIVAEIKTEYKYLNPSKIPEGEDTQLEKAIEIIMGK